MTHPMPGFVRSARCAATFAIALGVIGLGTTASAAVIIVNNGESIQSAVDAAEPGDIIQVMPGTYTSTAGDESVVWIRERNITIAGSTHAVIDADGFEYGIMVGEDAEISAAGCPPITVEGFTLRGLTVANADETAVLLIGVDGFLMSHTNYVDNPENGDLLLVDPDPSDNCFSENFYDTDFPPGIIALFPCP